MSNRNKRSASSDEDPVDMGEAGGSARGLKQGRRAYQTASEEVGPSHVEALQSTTSENDSNADIFRKIDLPPTIDLEHFVSARKDELANLTNTVRTRMRKLVSQQLPRHLRRRTVSHNKKRLPKRMQDRYNAEAAKETKRPSRLHRRRPRNLQDEYTRRARSHRWLETHIWHAKRFRMVEKFGYKIPESSFDKSLRACYRGAAKYCLLNDISYECCIELRGEQAAICGAFERISSQKTGLSVAAKKFIDGRFQGSIWLYQIDSYPHKCLGEATFIWRPLDAGISERILWLWCHPEFRETLIDIFKQLLDLVADFSGEGATEPSVFKGPTVTLINLQDKLNRFRLTGPLSARVLCEALTQDESGLELAPPLSLQPDEFNTFWSGVAKNALSAFSHIRDGQIAGNVVLDPRLHMPRKRLVSTVVGLQADDEGPFDSKGSQNAISEVPFRSDIWDQSARSFVKRSMMTQDEINKLQHDSIVPGTPLALGVKESRIPILVIFRGGSQDHLGYSRGCDIILPSGWGRQFFIALNYRSARAAGFRDLSAITRYSGKFVFPDDIPDSILAAPHLSKETDDLLTKHIKYPPNKRPPFAKLGLWLPYSLPFGHLIEKIAPPQCESPRSRFFVLRDRVLLKQLAEVYKKPQQFVELVKTMPANDVELALIPVKVTSPKGVPARFARLYGLPDFPGPMQEPVHTNAWRERTVTKNDLTQGFLNAAIDNLYQIVGFLVSGDRNYTEKYSTGLGYVSLQALVNVLEAHDNVIAFRNQHCFNYHLVQMVILC